MDSKIGFGVLKFSFLALEFYTFLNCFFTCTYIILRKFRVLDQKKCNNFYILDDEINIVNILPHALIILLLSMNKIKYHDGDSCDFKILDYLLVLYYLSFFFCNTFFYHLIQQLCIILRLLLGLFF